MWSMQICQVLQFIGLGVDSYWSFPPMVIGKIQRECKATRNIKGQLVCQGSSPRSAEVQEEVLSTPVFHSEQWGWGMPSISWHWTPPLQSVNLSVEDKYFLFYLTLEMELVW